MKRILTVILSSCLLLQAAHATNRPIVVGSKRFTESYVLGEIVRQTLLSAEIPAEHKQGMGNTAILEQALLSGEIDVYPEYTGTIVRELLKRPAETDATPSLADLNRWLAPLGLKAGVPLGFNNTYALAMREADAARLHVDSISSLARLPLNEAEQLRFGLSHEFLVRADGWPALKRSYALPFAPGSGLDHGLAYNALAGGQVDVIDVYATDAQIGRLKLRVLHDDRAFFPRYDAVLLMRASLDERPLAAALAGKITEADMIRLNGAVEIDKRSFADVAQAFLASPHTSATRARAIPSQNPPDFVARLFAPDLARLCGQHLALVFGSLFLAILVGIPIGVLAFLWPRLAGTLMGSVGILQTIPSLALLSCLIALMGRIGFAPALVALFIYALLPIVRNTHAGLSGVPTGLGMAARALGLRDLQVLRLISLPLAAPAILAGIKTAAVINVGTATVAAFVGAGGLGERIVSGLAVNDTGQMLAGAIPAALLAIVVQWGFDQVEARFIRSQG